MIIGTAGHIDHGKTTLVRALTGVDTDRLPEEKARGISIELGYAYTPVPDGNMLGFIDVPGHERLVHTMVAGACGIDFGLLVVAADDGVMPQTREHIAILELLGVCRGAVALTKVDRVDDARLEEVRSQVRAALASSALRDSPMYAVNATASDDPGAALLRSHLQEVAVSLPSRRDRRLFRLAVDRVFTLSGHGTVATGTVFSGEVGVGDTVSIMPSGASARVRSVHAQNRPTELGLAGQRCALNLAGIETSALSRGDWLADPRLFLPTTRIDVRLRLLPAAAHSAFRMRTASPFPHGVTTAEANSRGGAVTAEDAARDAVTSAEGDLRGVVMNAEPVARDCAMSAKGGGARDRIVGARGAGGLTSWSTLHVHLGTARRVAHVVPLESEVLRAGHSARVQLVFDAPICTLPGDRFIVRDAQAAHTIGGGVVLDPFAPARRRRSAARLLRLDALERLSLGPRNGTLDSIDARHGTYVRDGSGARDGIDARDSDCDGITALLRQAPHGLRVSELVRLTALPPERLALPPDARVIDANTERFVLHASQWATLRERALEALRTFHAQLPDDPGPDVGRLRRIALPDLPDPLWRALVGELISDRLLVRNGPWLHLPGHNASLSESDAALVRKLQPAIIAGRFDPPWVRDLATKFSEPEERVRSVLRKSVTQGTVCQVVRDLFYDRDCINELVAIATRLAHESGTVEAARYRDMLGLGRKRTIQILEFFDRVGYTRRVKDSHVLRQDSGWRL